MPTNILVAGVGGQGILLVGKLIARAAQLAGFQVKTSEIHGMAQRGGSVITHVRYGPEVYSPVIAPGTADFLLAFEKLEGRRALPFLRPEGLIILNDYTLPPLRVALGLEAYPSDTEEYLARRHRLLLVPALAEARRYGLDSRSVNVLLAGVLAACTAIAREIWEEALRDVLPPRFLEVNQRAFARGFDLSITWRHNTAEGVVNQCGTSQWNAFHGKS
ncbi:indolepyruvate oxidoreductase subunit beta [Desulfothermobacter acidiphilus]|uniref:indolepyruvate oxidoreductase subunit beta n=1 Tax=Desulfothermobacter acidiphilus TaxID=1938353 RepID=UPI003F897AAA